MFKLGYDPVWFGIVIIMLIETALITPPVGLNLFVVQNLRKSGSLNDVIIGTLADFGILGERREDRVGVWVRRGQREDKIAAIGIRVRKGISFHGLSINLNPDLTHFSGIVPCGVTEHGVTSFADLGLDVSMAQLDAELQKQFAIIFGP